MNINCKNGLPCITNLNDLPRHTVLRPPPGLPVVRDLVVHMTAFFKQYDSIKPYLSNDTPSHERERRQTPEERDLPACVPIPLRGGAACSDSDLRFLSGTPEAIMLPI